MNSAPSLAGRLALAIILMICFYLLALAMAGALLYIPYGLFVWGDRIPLKLVIFCVVGAGVILWSIIPRPDRFLPPGPRLTRQVHPTLYAEVDEIARATGQAPPVDIYLVPEVNAWVTHRGGVMGMGSRRVMGLGLPLLPVLTVSQLRAVLAHEFGHYHGGDTKLGPWIYKTRAAIGRTLQGLAQHSSLLSKPFEWYGNAFVRITHAVSRRQEYTADALAAQVAGARPLAEALRRIHTASLAYSGYWKSELGPALDRGYRPPVADGFRRFLSSPAVAEQLSRSLENELKEGTTSPYDTHPQLAERLAALATLPQGEVQVSDGLAITLLEQLPETEEQLVLSLFSEPASVSLEPVGWEDLPARLWIPMWEKAATEHRESLCGLTPALLPEFVPPVEQLAVRLRLAPSTAHANEQHVGEATSRVGAALSVLLYRAGWRLSADPGAAVSFEKNGAVIRSFGIVSELASGEVSAKDWQILCRQAGIADCDLGNVVHSIALPADPSVPQLPRH